MPKAKFLTDENVAPAVVNALRAQGFNVKDIKEEDLTGISDHKVLSLANREDRIVITYDQDFANLLNHPFQSHKGIILLRYSDLRKTVLIQKFLPLLNSLARRKLLGNLVIIDDKMVKIIKKKNKSKTSRLKCLSKKNLSNRSPNHLKKPKRFKN